MTKRVLYLALALLGAPLLWGAEDATALYMYKYDVDSTDVAWCRMLGQQGSPFGGSIPGPGRIKTSGSSVTITSQTALDYSFAGVNVGDMLEIRTAPDTVALRKVITNADDDTVTVDSAITLSDVAYRFLRQDCGTAATSGWIDLSGYTNRNITIQYDQGDLGSLDIQVQCKPNFPGAAPIQIFPSCTVGACATYQAYTTVGLASRTSVEIGTPFGSCRVGFKYSTSDASEAGANLEQVTVGVQAQREN